MNCCSALLSNVKYQRVDVLIKDRMRSDFQQLKSVEKLIHQSLPEFGIGQLFRERICLRLLPHNLFADARDSFGLKRSRDVTNQEE